MSALDSIKRLLKMASYSLVFLFSTLFLLSAFILFTHTGNQGAIKLITHYESRLTLTLDKGTLLNHPHFSTIGWDDGQSSYQLEGVTFQIGWRCFFNTLCIDSLNTKKVSIVIEPTETEQVASVENNSETAFKFPFPIYTKDINIQNINVNVAGVNIIADAFLLNADAINDELSLNSTVTGLTVSLPASNIASTQVSASLSTPPNPVTTTRLPALLTQANLPKVSLPFHLKVEDLQVNKFALKKNKQTILKVNQADTRFTFHKTQLHIDHLNTDFPELDTQITGNIHLENHYPMNLTLNSQLKTIPVLQPQNLLAGQLINLHLVGDLSHLTTSFNFNDVINAKGQLNVDLLSDNLPYQLAVTSPDISWPLTGKSDIKTTALSIKSEGDLSHYDLAVDGAYDIAGYPTGVVSLLSEGDLTSLSLSRLFVKTLEGTAELQGQLSWQKQLQWDGNLSVNNINLHALNQDYTGEINGTIKQSIHVALDKVAPTWSFDFPMIDLDGTLLAHPLTVKGSLKGDNESGLYIPGLNIENDQNTAVIRGKVADKNDLKISVNIGDLSQLEPNTKGRLTGQINLTGNIDDIKANADLTATRLRYLSQRVKKVTLKGQVAAAALPIVSLELEMQGLKLNDQSIEHVALNVSPEAVIPRQVSHSIDLSVDNHIATTNLHGRFVQQLDNWQGQLQTGTVESKQGIWTLQEPVKISYEQQAVLLSPHCWLSTHKSETASHLCVHEFSAGENGQLEINANNVFLDSLQPFVSSGIKLEGHVDANTKIQWQKDKPLTANFNLNGEEIAFNILIENDDDEEEFVRYPVEKLAFNVETAQGKTNFTVNTIAKDLIIANLSGKISELIAKKPKIKASGELLVPDFSTFSVLVPQAEQIAGQLQAALSIEGDLKHPMVSGQVLIADGVLTSLQSPVQISSLNASIEIEESEAQVDGYFFTNSKITKKNKTNSFIAGLILLKETAVSALNIPQRIADINDVKTSKAAQNGRADFSGKINWQQTQPTAAINFKAEKMHLSDYGKTDLYISPDINLLYDHQLTVEGQIDVNQGEITIKELPEGAVTVSDDVVVVDHKVKKSSADLPIVMDLKVDLGDQLHINALGLDSYILGDLLIRKPLTKAITVNGELGFSEGTYQAFAQQLVIQNSRVIFQGPVDSPYISLEAIRDPNNIEDNVTAGVRVTGVPSQLELSLFSDTSLSQQNILSYITRGQAIKENSSVSNNQIAAALLSFGTGRTEDLVNNLGAQVGINDLALATSGEGDEQSIGIKGTIAPGIELGYGVGVFDTFDVFSIRYKLFEKFYIEASSGLSQAVDAYYEWDWD